MRSVEAILYDNDEMDNIGVRAQHQADQPMEEQWARWRTKRWEVKLAAARSRYTKPLLYCVDS